MTGVSTRRNRTAPEKRLESSIIKALWTLGDREQVQGWIQWLHKPCGEYCMDNSCDRCVKDNEVAATLLALMERCERQHKLLLEVEWVTHSEIGIREYGQCPICHNEGAEDHKPDCELAAALHQEGAGRE